MRSAPLLCLGALLGCAPTDTPAAPTRVDSSGVEIVRNSGIDRPFAGTVSVVDTVIAATAVEFTASAGGIALAADTLGHLVLVDGDRVLRRDLDGTLRQVGGPGAGPGEYEIVGAVSVAPDGALLVADLAKKSFVPFGADGRPQANIPWSLFGEGYVRSVGHLSGGYVAVLGVRSSEASTLAMYVVTPADTLLLAHADQPIRMTGPYASCNMAGHLPEPVLFAPTIRWAANGVAAAFVLSDGYRVDLWHDGRITRSIRRDLPPRAATPALAAASLGEGIRVRTSGNASCLIPAAEVVEKRGMAATIPVIRRVALAPTGEIWVERAALPGEPRHHDLFDRSGAYLGTVTDTLRWPAAWMPGGRYVAVEADADSLPVVVRYAVAPAGTP